MDLSTETLIKKEFAHIDTLYFNTAYFGPSPYRAKQKVSNALFKELDPSFFPYNTWMGIPDRIRTQIASLLGTKPHNIAHCTSTGDIINIIANGLKLKDDEVIVALNGDYPSDILPWMLAKENYGHNFQLIDVQSYTVDAIMDALPENTKVFSFSHVAFDSGRKIDLLPLCSRLKEKGIFTIVDGTQSFGGMPILKEELELIDVLSVSCYKWMLGPYGYSFGHFSDNAIDMIRHKNANWTTSTNSKVVYNLLNYTTETLKGARKYDRGQAPNMLTMACLEASLELFHDIDLKTVATHNTKIRDYFLQRYPKDQFKLITPIDQMGYIISLKAKGIDPVLLEAELKHNNIDVSVREGNIRLSFHIFNTIDQVDTLIYALSSV